MKKNENPLSVYAKVSQLAFVIVTPLLVFLLGGSYLVKRFNLPDWVMLICVGLAILFMISGAVNFIFRITAYYEKKDKDKKIPKAFTSSPRDNDYYDEYRK
ncbi:MAG: AtpZ/AtpI family protein [Oscillospiraceae bacterium]